MVVCIHSYCELAHYKEVVQKICKAQTIKKYCAVVKLDVT